MRQSVSWRGAAGVEINQPETARPMHRLHTKCKASSTKMCRAMCVHPLNALRSIDRSNCFLHGQALGSSARLPFRFRLGLPLAPRRQSRALHLAVVRRLLVFSVRSRFVCACVSPPPVPITRKEQQGAAGDQPFIVLHSWWRRRGQAAACRGGCITSHPTQSGASCFSSPSSSVVLWDDGGAAASQSQQQQRLSP